MTFAVVSMGTVETVMPTAAMAVRVSALQQDLDLVQDQEWATYSPAPCSLPSFPTPIRFTLTIPSSRQQMHTHLSEPREARINNCKK
jgi:hypothetical protein